MVMTAATAILSAALPGLALRAPALRAPAFGASALGAPCARSVSRAGVPVCSLARLIEDGAVVDAVANLERDESARPTRDQMAALLDSACVLAAPTTGPPDEALERERQDALLRCYKVLAARGALRGFSSAGGRPEDPDSLMASLPAGQPRILLPEAQLELTGLPTTAFAPPPSNGFGTLVAGALTAAALAALSTQYSVDLRPVVLSAGGLLVADRVALRGAMYEAAARTLSPAYAKTIAQHEAGHLVVAYLLGMPVQACGPNHRDAPRNP